MPGVRSHAGWCRVIPGHGNHIWIKLEQDIQGCIDALDDLGLGLEITIFTAAVGFLDVNKEEIELSPMFSDC